MIHSTKANPASEVMSNPQQKQPITMIKLRERSFFPSGRKMKVIEINSETELTLSVSGFRMWLMKQCKSEAVPT